MVSPRSLALWFLASSSLARSVALSLARSSLAPSLAIAADRSLPSIALSLARLARARSPRSSRAMRQALEARLVVSFEEIRKVVEQEKLDKEDETTIANMVKMWVKTRVDRYIDEDQLVINLKKRDSDLNWPDIMESWESLLLELPAFLKERRFILLETPQRSMRRSLENSQMGLGYVFLCLHYSY
ncbi:hypothetical protein Syun_019654 [Stephania yunnanensis]|uniref:Uncharacterized protein n=1 Tax=Stephania yunnanensis TaxID=152371 RepID=A0AAP0IUG2_9MAGN